MPSRFEVAVLAILGLPVMWFCVKSESLVLALGGILFSSIMMIVLLQVGIVPSIENARTIFKSEIEKTPNG